MAAPRIYLLRIDTLRVRIDRQPLLRHLRRILEEAQRHPDKMSLDLVQIASDVLIGHVWIVDVALLPVAAGQEVLVVVERADVVVRVGVEDVPEGLGVLSGAVAPKLPEVVRERVADKLVVFVAGAPVVVAVLGRLGVRVVGCVELLGWEEAEVFAPEHAAEGCGVVTCLVWLAVHFGFERVGVFHHDCEFGVMEAELGL